eukprot:scaffold106503_cov24-Phaeocystis_antarctica.AAC.1
MGGKFRGLGLRCCSADRRMGVGPVGWPSRRSMRPVAGACGAHPRGGSSKDTRETAGHRLLEPSDAESRKMVSGVLSA